MQKTNTSYSRLHGVQTKQTQKTVSLALGKPLMGPLEKALRIAQASNCPKVMLSNKLQQALVD